MTGYVEVHLIAQVCSDPLGGHAQWTLRMLADLVVELGGLEDWKE